MGIQFIFFAPSFRLRFLGFLDALGIPATTQEQQPEGYVVEIPDDLTDEVYDRIEHEYNTIVEAQITMANHADENAFQVLGVTLSGEHGDERLIRIEGPLGRRLSQHFTPEEIHELVSLIIHSYTTPQSGPLCLPEA